MTSIIECNFLAEYCICMVSMAFPYLRTFRLRSWPTYWITSTVFWFCSFPECFAADTDMLLEIRPRFLTFFSVHNSHFIIHAV